MGKKKHEGASSRGPAIWDDESVSVFCDCCIKEIEAGRRPGSHFNKAGWDSLIVNFSKAVGRDYDKPQLKNKWDSLKGDYRLWKALIGKETGLGWSSSKKTVDASEEWWQSKVKEDSNLKKFRKKGIDPEMEEKLKMMFTKVGAEGNVMYGPSVGVLLSESVAASTSHTNPVEGSDDSDESQDTRASEGSGKKRKSGYLGTQTQGNKGTMGTGKVGGAAKLSRQIERFIDVVESRNSSVLGLVKPLQGSSVVETMALLEALPGGEEGSELWFFASNLFMSSEKRQMFCSIKSPEVKLQWLNRQMPEKTN